ncbi:AMP-binding protein [Actinomadura madurae]|uniref:AMP-binding protein n=1 Tax=Actinomadura madurae TaxID=1993 RepID=UPI000D84333F|nr:AMP-binding protein [Actinomadura madurae]SPT50153.1 2-succinylbenzoate--CoA ligase [Actinomadura madurae]
MDAPLTPLRFLERAAEVHPNATAVIDGSRKWTWSEFARDVTVLARALLARDVQPGDRVAYLATNSAELLAAHFAVPLIRAALVAINTRLSPGEVRYIRAHSGAKLLIGDGHLVAKLAGGSAEDSVREIVELPCASGGYDRPVGTTSYADLLSRGDGGPLPWEVDDEDRVIAINYTSGTTGDPKGVEYTHRGAYLNALGEVYHQGFRQESRYLWTLPMFHCNGWCTTWALTAAAGTHVCLRAVRGSAMWELIDRERISHMAGAPTVLTTLATAAEAHALDRPLTVVTAGAPPSPTTIGRIQDIGADVVHVYGLTETYGPYAVCEPQPSWTALTSEELALRLARQGVGMLTSDRLRVVRRKPDIAGELTDVTPDGTEVGEIVMRGNSVMKAYHRDPGATARAFTGGWFHSGDLGVMHPDGYVQLVDRAKDVIISGGENISTVEVEQALLSHPAVLDVAVVGIPDEKWGERPMAFVVTAGAGADEATEWALIAHVRDRIAHYKAPREIEFVPELPKTSTGKTRKHELRERRRRNS